MDTITHGVAGALVAKSFFSEREGRMATAAITLGAIFPDSDAFANLFITNELARLQIHRGLTHSLVALPVFAFLLGALACLGTRRRHWLKYSAFFGIGIGLHVLLDLITPFGTMIWSPLSNARAALDLVFIIDLTFTGIVLLPQLAAWVYADRHRALLRGWLVWFGLSGVGVAAGWLTQRLQIPLSMWTVAGTSLLLGILLWLPGATGVGFRWRRSFYCRIGVAALTLYLGLCTVAHRAALARVKEFAARSGLEVQGLAALPAPPSLVHWSGLIQTPEGIHRVTLDLLHAGPESHEFFAHAEKNDYVEKAEALAGVKTYLWFARFPWVTYRQHNGVHFVEYQDLQFYLPFRRSNSPFTFLVSFDGDGRLIQSDLLAPEGFWSLNSRAVPGSR